MREPAAGSPSTKTKAPCGERGPRAAIAAAITCVAVVGIGLSLSVSLLSLEMERMGASSTVIGLNTAVGGLASIATVPFVPRVAARTGVVRLLVAAIVVGAACLVGFRLWPGLAAWFVLRFVFSMSLGALFVLSEFWIVDAAPPSRRGLVMGVYATILALGFAVGPALLAFLGTEGFPPYLAGAGLFLAGLAPLAFARGLSPRLETAPRRHLLGYVRAAPAATLAALVYGAVETGGFAILPLYGLRLGYGAEAAAGLVSAIALGNVAFQIPFGWLADRLDRRRVLFAGAAGSVLASGLIPLVAGSGPWLVVVLFAWGGLTGTLYTVGLAHLGAGIRGADLAGANAAFVVLYNLGLMLGPPVIGGGMDLMPPHGFAAALAALLAAYAALVAWRMRG